MAPQAAGSHPSVPDILHFTYIFTTRVLLFTQNHKTLPWYGSFANLFVFILNDSNCRNSNRSRGHALWFRSTCASGHVSVGELNNTGNKISCDFSVSVRCLRRRCSTLLYFPFRCCAIQSYLVVRWSLATFNTSVDLYCESVMVTAINEKCFTALVLSNLN